ncbi:MAG TPA: peroxiredoxin-like family protein [Opitutaceae bacterium]|jgi:peroxiredoxin|nr:peroxiredoxin-like family protein [Opitutaceae bacterium]
MKRYLLLLILGLGTASVRAALPSSEEAVRPLGAGAAAPTAVLTSLDGQPADLAAVFAAKPTILIFYRGGWCPFCNHHLAALADAELDLRRLGYQIVAISPDPVPTLHQTAEKLHLRFHLLSDRNLQVAGRYQVAYEIPAAAGPDYKANGVDLPKIPGSANFWLTIPTAFVIGRDGRIKFVSFNADPSVMIPADQLVAAARAALAGTAAN